MRVKRSIVAAMVGTLAVTGLAACSSSGGSAGSANTAAVLNVGMPDGPQSENNNPFLQTSAATNLGYRFMIYEPLVMLNDIKPAEPGKPWLATKWDWSDNYSKLVLTIRDGVKFSDGTPMTAADVAYTFQLLKDNASLNIDAVPFKDITTTGNTVTLGFAASQFVNQVKILRQVIVPKHIWSTYASPTTEVVKNPIGTGPYTLKSFSTQTVTITRRDGYWQNEPEVKEIHYTSYTDNNSQTAALVSGAADWSFVFIPNAKAVFTGKDPAHYKLFFPPVLAVHGLWFNTTTAPYNNPALRQAISKVLNRDDIFNQGEAGYFYPKVDNVTGIPTPAGDSFIAQKYQGKIITPDVAAAKATLTAAGFTYQGTKLIDPTGKPVTLKLTVPSGWSDYITDLTIIKDNVSGIGIDASVTTMNQDAWTKSVDTGQFDAIMHWTDPGATPYDIYKDAMSGDLFKPIGTGGTTGNYGRYQNPDATAALATYANAADAPSRTAAMEKLQDIMVQQQPMVPTSAGNEGGEYSTKHWTGWPDENNQYGPAQPTLRNALDIVLHLKAAS
ncbi:MAG: dipeptide/oligopeptide transporter periplasmic protein [Amycolatopsis sp.]|jgi:peptide/nickel transport system substrate-binding protein|uniref:ABC transporter substrate-binding protein n=1 Tax=Amycolatopsis sp. TaxID=37632 RepID=UPI00262AF522|nr:ABC transporter substrate-binding protein [Amycolatopsis sp.]MCU1679891.1 dipeptide/oligopeptide transporter periplasmic protein [Amycolatopsis sp.]